MDITGFKSKDGTVHKYDYNALANKPVIPEDSGGNAGQSGLTSAQIEALDGMFRIAAYTADASNAYSAFKTAFGIGGEAEPDQPDTPDAPDEPEVTLTGISAVYSGGDVAAGTAVTALTGIAVTAQYSDGTSKAVSGYTLSGTIAEGSNTITVSYGGMSAEFTVTGVAAAGGEETTENLLYSWDFTSGLTDSVTGKAVTLSGATQDSDGLHLTGGNNYALLGVSVANKIVEIEFGEVAHSGFTGHGRLVTFNNSDTGSDCSRGLIWRNTNIWSSYFGSWKDSGNTDPSALSNKTVRIRFSGATMDVLAGDEVLFDGTSANASYRYLALGAASNAFYNATIKRGKVYEEVA